MPVWQLQCFSFSQLRGRCRVTVSRPNLSSVPKFLREKLRGLVDAVMLPLADWIPTIPPAPSASKSRAKSLRMFSMLSLSFSPKNASANQTCQLITSTNMQRLCLYIGVHWSQLTECVCVYVRRPGGFQSKADI